MGADDKKSLLVTLGLPEEVAAAAVATAGACVCAPLSATAVPGVCDSASAAGGRPAPPTACTSASDVSGATCTFRLRPLRSAVCASRARRALERLPLADTNRWQNTAQLLVQGPLVDAQSVALIPAGDIPEAQIEQLQRDLSEALGHRTLLVTRDLIASRDCSCQLLVTASGACKRQELQQLREQLALQGTPVAGWLLIDPALEG